MTGFITGQVRQWYTQKYYLMQTKFYDFSATDGVTTTSLNLTQFSSVQFWDIVARISYGLSSHDSADRYARRNRNAVRVGSSR